MRHYILFTATGYNGEPKDAKAALLGFERMIEGFEATSQMTLKVSEHSFLFDRGNDIALFGKVVAAAEAQHLKYEVKFLSED